MARLIPDRGPRSARIVVVGEAPGQQEWEAGAPFVGPSGRLLERWMMEVGIDRSAVYWTNVVGYWPGEFAPPQIKVGRNDFKWLPPSVVTEGKQSLQGRLASLDDPIVLVPCGNKALEALGCTAPGGKISDYRGSILSTTLTRANGETRSVKTIPTIHPAATLRRPVLTKFCLADWARIKDDSGFRDLRIPKRETVVADSAVIHQFMADLVRSAGPVAVDIECDIKTQALQCVAFATHPDRAIVVPLGSFAAAAERERNLQWVRELCGSTAPKVLQNGLFDQFVLARKGGIDLVNYLYDTLELNHLLDPNDGSDPTVTEEGGDDIKLSQHSLAVLGSLHTRQPYYKGDAREGFRTNWSERIAQLFDYCGLDAMVTIEIFHKLREAAQQRGLL